MVTVKLGYVRSDGTPVFCISYWWRSPPSLWLAMPEFQEWARTNPRHFRRNLIVRYGGW